MSYLSTKLDPATIFRTTSVLLRLLILPLLLVSCGDGSYVMPEKAFYSLSGNTKTGPFSIERLELEFSPGIIRHNVVRGQTLQPTATIKFSGRGVLLADWMLDNRVVDQVNLNLSHGSVLKLSPSRLLHTEALTPGQHWIMLKIRQPAPSFSSPSITFFVTEGSY